MIPDTSGQDTLIASGPAQAKPKRLVWLAVAAVGAALIVTLLSSWLGSSRSVDVARIRIAEVTRGTLVRDASVNGRVVAAVSPTLYAPAAEHRHAEDPRRRQGRRRATCSPCSIRRS
jgi:HlyD family secretion protein